MNENEFLARTVCDLMERELPAVVISLLSSQGSTPRHEGSKMVIGSDGTPYGTIGGSLLEAAAIELARKALKTKQSSIFEYELSGEDATSPGMICGGSARVLLDYLAPTPENRTFAANWNQAICDGADCFLCTCIRQPVGNDVEIPVRTVLMPNGRVSGDPLPDGIDATLFRDVLRTINSTALLTCEGVDILIDPVSKLKTLYCFGAGHVAVPTAHIAALTGFRVVVLDDRAEFANQERFPDAHEILIIDDFTTVFSRLSIDTDSFIVIVTRGHEYDRVVLEQALTTGAGYIGMISSRKKRDTIYTALKKTGVSDTLLNTVHSPIGLDIGGETPEEIAVSIVAELISVRNSQKS